MPAIQIVVTAAKEGQTLYTLPRAVTVVPLSRSDALNPTSGSSLVASESEGLTLTGLGPGRNRMFLRGVADSPLNGDSQSTVAVVLDDSRLTYSAPDPDLRLIDVERVELLKGPQGSLYGTGVLGGIYNIVSRSPDLAKFSLTGSVGAAALTGGNAGWSSAAVLNVPLASDVLGFRLAAYAESEPGWVDTGLRRDSNSGRTLGGRARLRAELGGPWQFDLVGQLQRLEIRDSQYVYVDGARSRTAQPGEPHDNDLDHIGLRLTGAIESADVTFLSGLTRHEVQDTLALTAAPSFGLIEHGLWNDNRAYRIWDNEVRLSGLTSGGLKWLAGFSYLEARQAAVRSLSELTRPRRAIIVEDVRRTATDSAAFASATIPVGANIEAEIGGRLFHGAIEDRRSGAFGKSGIREVRRNGLTPAIALAWRPSTDRIVWLRYGSAFRQGGIAPDADGELRNFSGDELSTIEAGWRQVVSDGASLDIGVHYTWWEDVQSDTLLANGLIETRNVGRARIIGSEISLRVQLRPSWNLELGATIEAARLVRNDLGIALDDRRLPVIPDYVLRGAITRQLWIGESMAEFRFGLRYTGPARLSFDPALDRPLGRSLEGTAAFEAPTAQGRLALRIDNLFNSNAETFAFGNQFTASSKRQHIPHRPRALAVTYTAGF